MDEPGRIRDGCHRFGQRVHRPHFRFCAIGHASDGEQAALHWVLLALGAALLAGMFLGGLIFGQHSE